MKMKFTVTIDSPVGIKASHVRSHILAALSRDRLLSEVNQPMVRHWRVRRVVRRKKRIKKAP